MAERMMGLETEHGFYVEGLDIDQRGGVLEKVMRVARKRMVHLPACHGTGIFLANGSRFYIDTGAHPEFCTPEVDDPWQLVRYICAGDLILQRLAEETLVAEQTPEIVFHKCHVDYRDCSTWGCHENFAHRGSPNALPAQLIPHLASRLLICGAGGLDPHAHGIEFVLSPRACHLHGATCHSSTDSRGIYHFKDESLSCPGWSRLHLLCGESVMSHRAMLLKAGTTALVVAMIEGGLNPGVDVRLKMPIEAMRAFNADTTAGATGRLAAGGHMTALEIQRHYLEFAEAHLAHGCMPAWAAPLCRCWRETLDSLRRGIPAVDRMLDWAIKHSLYEERIRRRGITSQQLAFWNQVLRKFGTRRTEAPAAIPPLTAGCVLGAVETLRKFETSRSELGLAWEEVDNVLQLRAELCELEVRFSRLGPKGIFHALDRAGFLQHAVPEVTLASIEEATETPPARGRAGVRGALIRKLQGHGRYTADWSGVSDLAGRWINLSDPFPAGTPDWQPSFGEDTAGLHPARQLLERIERQYDSGEYEAAWSALNTLRQIRRQLPRPVMERTLQLTAWVQSRRGQPAEALQALDELAGGNSRDLEKVNDVISTLRFNGLVARPELMLPWVQQADELLAQSPEPPLSLRLAIPGHKAALLARTGSLAEARGMLVHAFTIGSTHNPQSRVLARNLCDLAELHRRLGDERSAEDCLERAGLIQISNRYEGDFAEFNLPRRARMIAGRAMAKSLLNQARLIQRRLGHRVGMVKTVLLQARLFPSLWHNQRRKRILLAWHRDLPMLRDCPLMNRIMAHWEDWVSGVRGEGDEDFWGM
ncbi:MAG: proteasome accessory factor [Verrucomicrobiota bacterium]|jgi:proteasome accessory factor A